MRTMQSSIGFRQGITDRSQCLDVFLRAKIKSFSSSQCSHTTTPSDRSLNQQQLVYGVKLNVEVHLILSDVS